MQTYPISIIYHPKEVGSMVPIASSVLAHDTIKTLLEKKGYRVIPVTDDHARYILTEKRVGVGCFLLDGSNIIIDDERRDRALNNFHKLVPELNRSVIFDPVSISC